MKATTRAKTWFRALVAAVICAASANALADCYKYDVSNGTVANLGSEKQIDSTDRFIIYQGTVNLNAGASVKCGGNTSGSCNFIGVDRNNVSGVLNINGGTFWCATAKGSGYLGVGNNNRNVTSYLTLNSGTLKVDAVLRSGVQWDDSGAATSSGTITINGGEATVGTVLMGATTVSTGVSTLNLNDGTLTTGNITFRKGNGQVFTWGGGTLVAMTDNIFNFQTFDASNTKTRTLEITGNPASFDTAGYAQTIPAFTGTGKLRLTGNGTASFEQSTLSYGLVLDGIILDCGTLDANTPRLTVPSLEITGPVVIRATPPATPSERYPLIECTSSLDGVSLDQVTVAGGAGTLVREGNTIYVSVTSTLASMLLHRWSFNGDYTDSVGGLTGTDNGTSVTFVNNNTAISLAGGNKGTSWVDLNPGKSSAILPPGDAPFTIEMWTKLRAITNYSAWFTLGRKDNYNVKGLMVAFHNPNAQVRAWNNSTGTGPAFKAVKSNQDANNVLMGKNPLTAGGTYHLAIVVTPRGDGNGATIEGYVHDATTGARIGGYAYTVTGWTTASLIRETFALGRNFWNDPDPQADYDEVRVWNAALSISQIEANIASGPDALPAAYPAATIANPLFRYDFTHGTRVFTGNNGTDPAGTATGNVAVKGPNGENTAVHPKGFGTIYDGDNKLNADWTIAMSVKCCNTEKGAVFSVGSNGTLNKKQFVVATSSTNGKLYVPIFQKWGNGNNYRNIPAIIELTNLGDTTNTFHTLVAVHAQGTPYSVMKGGSITLYWDGKPVGSLHSAYQSGDRPFANGFQLSSAHGGFGGDISAYSDMSGNNNLAFQDVRFFDRALSAEEAQLYAEAFPPCKVGDVIDDFLFRYDFTSGTKVYSHYKHPIEPTASWSGYTAVNGPNGYGTAVHACGTGTITDGDTKLNEDWTLAMSVKSCDVEKGVILCLGKCDTNQRKQLAICSSSTPGKLHIAAIQRYNTGSGVNVPLTLNHASLGDTTNSFHTLVAVHEASKGTKKFPNQQETGLITFYWDGAQIGTIDTGTNGGERLFESGFRFSTLNTGCSGYNDLTGNPDAALRDVRFFTRALAVSEIASYASLFPVATAAVCDVDDYHFRHNFATGKLAVEGTGFTDAGLVGTGTKVSGGVGGSKYASFPDKTGNGTVTGGLNRDWTLAMSVKAPSVESGKNGLMLTLGGVETSGKKALAISSTSDSSGGLFISVPQRYGSAESNINTCQAKISLNGLGDTTGKYHSLVIVHARNQKNDANAWQTGTFGIYWDGKYKGSIVNTDSRTLSFMDNLKYGAIYNRTLSGDGSALQPYYVEPEKASGMAFRDVRFYTKVLTSAEARAYAEEFPVADQAAPYRNAMILVE